MSYIRVYPSKNNTIFQRQSGSLQQTQGLINTGQNTISEIMTGNSYSTLVMQFDLTDLKTKLQNNSYTCNLQLYDAGTVFEPSLPLQNLDLFYFKEDFVEGDGFSYLDGKAIQGISNYANRDSVNTWAGVFTTGVLPAHSLNKANEDIKIQNLQTFIDDALTNNVNPNFGLRTSVNTTDSTTYTKFIFTRHTRTIYRPYLEFFIDDSIVDTRQRFIATKANKLFLINDLGENFVGTLTCEIKDDEGNTLDTPSIINSSPGVYSVTYTAPITLTNSFIFDVWSIDGVELANNPVSVQSPNQVGTQTQYKNLYYYPTSTITQPIVRFGDIIRINVVSEVRNRGCVPLPNYEFKVVNTANFEMQPWQPVNLVGDKMFAFIDTSFYFEEMEYEVFVRLKLNGEIKTSNLSYKFRLIPDEATHLKTRQSSAYNSRDYLFRK